MERGLVERIRGAGTFVRKGIKSRTAGIVFGENNFTRLDRAFYNLLLQCLMRRLMKTGWNFRHYIATEAPEVDMGFHELKKAVDDGSIRAVIEFCSNTVIKNWLADECQVPFSYCSPDIDYPGLLEQAMRHLLDHGRRNIAVLSGNLDHPECFDIYAKTAAQVMADYGLPESYVSLAKVGEKLTEGYEATMSILENPKTRPDALVAMNDSSCRGVIYAIMQKGLSIPEDISLITHANKGIEIFCHIPLTRLEIDPDNFAAAVIEEIMAKVEGLPYKPRPIKACLVPGISCGEEL
jgi:DNA-binding LacI/PurR family transcriptional regulator